MLVRDISAHSSEGSIRYNAEVVACRGGFILYRTIVPSSMLGVEGGALLDIGGPVHDYAQANHLHPQF